MESKYASVKSESRDEISQSSPLRSRQKKQLIKRLGEKGR